VTITINKGQLKPTKKNLEKGDAYVTVKPATIRDEGIRAEHLFTGKDSAYLTDIAVVEMWLTVIKSDILDENKKPLFSAEMELEDFLVGATALLHELPDVFWEIHEKVREANPQWKPPEPPVGEGEAEGNA